MGNVKVRKVISYILAPAEYRTWTMISQFKPKDINLKTDVERIIAQIFFPLFVKLAF